MSLLWCRRAPWRRTNRAAVAPTVTTRRLNASASGAGFSTLIRWRTAHSAPMSSRGWLIFVKVSIARIVVDPDAKTALDVYVIGRSVTRIRAPQTAAGHAATGRALHMSVPRAGTRPAMRFVGIAFVRPQARSLLVGTDAPYHFIAIGHDCTLLQFCR